MAKPEQVLIIEPPSELRFRGPFINPVTSYMKLINPIDKRVSFKIKTTAPKKYCVRPNSGVVEPKSIVEVAVSLQPFDFDPAEKNKHKFMVLTAILPDGEVRLEDMWQDINPECLMDSKLKCVFELPEDTNSTPGANDETVPVQEKVKWTTEAKAPSKPASEYSSDLAKVTSDIKNLRTEESKLRQENVELKEELMILKRAMQTETQNMNANKLAVQGSPPCANMVYIIIAVVVGMFGFILGKFIV